MINNITMQKKFISESDKQLGVSVSSENTYGQTEN